MFLKNIEADSYFSLRNIWFLKYELAAGYLNTSVKMYHLYLLNKWNNWLPGPRVQCSLINDKFSEFSSQTVPCVRVSCSKSCHLRGSYDGLISLSMSKFDSLISKHFLNTSVKMYHLYLLNKWNNWLPGPRVQCSLINDKFSEFSSQTVPCVRVSCSKSCHLRGSYDGLISLSMSKFDSLISKRFLYFICKNFFRLR